jgi:hypothetical protein
VENGIRHCHHRIHRWEHVHPFFILISFNSLFFRSAHWQKEVEVSDEEDASSSEGTPYEQEIEDTSEDDEVEDPGVCIFACACVQCVQMSDS